MDNQNHLLTKRRIDTMDTQALVYVAQAIYYTLVIVGAAFALNHIGIKSAQKMIESVIISNTEVIKAAVLEESRHLRHEQRLDGLEKSIPQSFGVVEERMERLENDLHEIKDLFQQLNRRMDELFKLVASRPLGHERT